MTKKKTRVVAKPVAEIIGGSTRPAFITVKEAAAKSLLKYDPLRRTNGEIK